jgi:hypothetical protein
MQAISVLGVPILIKRLSSLPSNYVGVDSPDLLRASRESAPSYTRYHLHLKGGEIIEKTFRSTLLEANGQSREAIKLDNEDNGEKEIRGLKTIIARLLAKELNDSYDSSKNQLENITGTIKKHAPELINDDDLTTLIVFYSLKTSLKNGPEHTGLFNRFPPRFLNHENEHFESRVRLIMKHLLIDIEGYENAQQIEKLRNFQPVMKAAGLDTIDHILNRNDLLALTFPGYLEGEDPPIRPWLSYQPGKWQGDGGKDLARRATFWLLKYGEGVVDDEGNYDLKRLKEVIESDAFNSTEYGTMGMLQNCTYTPNAVEAIRLAIPKAVGGKPNQLHRWKVKYDNKWEDKQLIDELTEYLVEHKLKCVDARGRVSAEKIVDHKNWHTEYKTECSTALKSNKSGAISAYNALSHKYPDLFGWRKEQIKPWQITQDPMWKNENGVKLFQSAMAYTLWSNGLGSMNSEAFRPKFSFTKSEFLHWYDERVKHNYLFIEDMLNENGLSSPYDTIAGKCQGGALEILFATQAPVLTDQKPRVRSTALALFKAANDSCTVDFEPVKKTVNRHKLSLDLLTEEITIIPGEQIGFKRQNRVGETPLRRYDLTHTKIKDILDNESGRQFLYRIKDLLLTIEDEDRLSFCNIEKIASCANRDDLLEFFETLRISFIDYINIDPRTKVKLKKLLEDILYVEDGQKEFLLETIKSERGLLKKGVSTQEGYLELIEKVTVFLYEVVREYDIQDFIAHKKTKKVC